jgi:hypothetical protein
LASGVLSTLEVSNCSPEIAVPMTVKMPDPMTAPMPSAVSDHGPSVFFSACSGSSESLMSLSIDLRASSWLGRAVLLVRWIAGHFSIAGFCRLGEQSSGAGCLRRSVQEQVWCLKRAGPADGQDQGV